MTGPTAPTRSCRGCRRRATGLLSCFGCTTWIRRWSPRCGHRRRRASDALGSAGHDRRGSAGSGASARSSPSLPWCTWRPWVCHAFIMHRVLNTSPAELGARTCRASGADGVLSADDRCVPAPHRAAPDLFYALCRFDLSHAPLPGACRPETARVTGRWRCAASNSDNFVVNDRELAGRPLTRSVVGPGATPTSACPARVVVAPSTRGIVLMYVLVGDYAAMKAGHVGSGAAHAALRCARAVRRGRRSWPLARRPCVTPGGRATEAVRRQSSGRRPDFRALPFTRTAGRASRPSVDESLAVSRR